MQDFALLVEAPLYLPRFHRAVSYCRVLVPQVSGVLHWFPESSRLA